MLQAFHILQERLIIHIDMHIQFFYNYQANQNSE
jgi:hypothetical protein